MKRTVVLLSLLLITLFILSACAPGVTNHSAERKAGVLWGVWHGWIAPISLIWQIFNPEVRIYEPNNVGWWYDFGFYLAILGGFGGFSLTRKKSRR
jgi:uncharacterized membrane protein HdeD (DUF308 family)